MTMKKEPKRTIELVTTRPIFRHLAGIVSLVGLIAPLICFFKYADEPSVFASALLVGLFQFAFMGSFALDLPWCNRLKLRRQSHR